MISQLDLESFKKFEQLSLELGQLTILTGLNGGGKSTVIQSILLAHRASLNDKRVIPLASEHGLDLGRGIDLLNLSAPSTAIRISTSSGNLTNRWSFAVPPEFEDRPYLQTLERPAQSPYPLGSHAFAYLQAERLGPRTSHPEWPLDPNHRGVGEDGRFLAYALAVSGRAEVAEPLQHPASGAVSTLTTNVESWMSSIVGGLQIEAALMSGTNIATLKLRQPGRGGEWMLPTNTGFGLSYSLPVVVAGLLARKDELLIVDSPEAHLHPSAQSAMGSFLAKVAASGVQVIIETHSDHVLNGVRKAVVSTGSVRSEQVQIYYFGEQVQPEKIGVSANGKMSSWPKGFFDQMDVDLAALAVASRTHL